LKRIKVLIIDDSALVRNILSQGLRLDPDIEVVGTASDPYIARDKIIALEPDVLTLDVEMPRMDGVEFLRKLMPQHPLPVLMVSSLTGRGQQITLDALEAGAVDFVTKPSSDVMRGMNEMLAELREKVREVSKANVSSWRKIDYRVDRAPIPATRRLTASSEKIVAIGASTGGTQALQRVLTALPATSPAIVIVQHMPSGFTRLFADRLNDLCAMSVKEAETGDRLTFGRVLIAPGDRHLKVVREGGVYFTQIIDGEKVCGHRPSVDVLFRSMADQVGTHAIGVVLTGMGSDGADALKVMRTRGARTLAQDEESSVVFGMPKEAFLRGGAEKLYPIDSIADAILDMTASG